LTHSFSLLFPKRLTKVCSAVQNQDFTLVEDYVLGLKAALYLMVHEPTRGWNGQSTPTIQHQKGKPVHSIGAELPNFGQYAQEKHELIAKHKQQRGPVEGNVQATQSNSAIGFNPTNRSSSASWQATGNGESALHRVPTIAQLLGSSLNQIVNYTDLDPVKQVVASIDKVTNFCFALACLIS
jgi:dihydropyrimidine dehydrogenase (NADP+)